MWQWLKDLLTYLEKGFSNYPFLKDVVIASLGVIFGGVVTVIINRGAIRKQALFDMKYDILKEQTKEVNELAKSIETIEICLSFKKATLSELSNDIESLQSALLKLNEDLEEKRRFVINYISATVVERSAQYVVDYREVFYVQGDGGLFDYQLKDKLSSDDINKLRVLIDNLKKLSIKLNEEKEKLIAPSLISRVFRKLRWIRLTLTKPFAWRKINKEKKKDENNNIIKM